MSELQSMLVGALVPLETLPGFPPAPNPPILFTLGLLFGLPLVVIIVVFGISQVSVLAQRGRGEATEIGDSVWLGSTPPGIESSGSTPALEAPKSGADAPAGTGGASGRW